MVSWMSHDYEADLLFWRERKTIRKEEEFVVLVSRRHVE